MPNLLYSIRAYIAPEHIGQAANRLDENEGGISKAVGALVPTLLAGILHKNSDPGAMDSIFRTLSNFHGGDILDNPASLLNGDNPSRKDTTAAAAQFLDLLFGLKVPAVTNAVAAFSGIKSPGVATLIGMVAPVAMGVLNKKISSGKLQAAGLFQLLAAEKNSILGALPTGLGSIIGLSDIGMDDTARPPAAAGRRWLWPFLLLAGLGGGMVFYLKQCYN